MITGNALPLTAVLNLNASPVQMGLLSAASSAPVLLVGLLAGVWVDRVRRRPILIAADLGRALLLASIPAAALLGLLRIEQLFVVAALVGILTVFFDVAYHSYLPGLVPREQIVEANSKLGMSDSLAEIAVPGLTGVLVQVISAPLTILLDAVSFLFSAFFLGLIRTSEPPPRVQPLREKSQSQKMKKEFSSSGFGAHPSVRPPFEVHPDSESRQGMWRTVTAGLRVLWANPVLRAMAAGSSTRDFFGNFFGALYGLYVIRELGFGPAILGVLIASGGLGALVGAAMAGPVMRRFGLGPTLVGTMFLMGAFALLIPLAGSQQMAAFALLLAAQLIGDLFRAIYVINELSLRQTITPVGLLGRVNASTNFMVGGAGTIGLLAGGILGERLGLRPAVTVAALGTLLGVPWLLFSPLRRLREPLLAPKNFSA